MNHSCCKTSFESLGFNLCLLIRIKDSITKEVSLIFHFFVIFIYLPFFFFFSLSSSAQKVYSLGKMEVFISNWFALHICCRSALLTNVAAGAHITTCEFIIVPFFYNYCIVSKLRNKFYCILLRWNRNRST